MICLCSYWNLGGAQTIYGAVTDDNTGESLIGAKIRVLPGQTGTQSDEYGKYHLSLSEFPVQLICSYVGYKPDTVTVSEAIDQEVNFALNPATLDEIIVSESRIPPPSFKSTNFLNYLKFSKNMEVVT